MRRVYLDHNATSPLRPEARAAMLAAMDALGNPSSVHSEGRAAKAIVEKARGQISEAFGVGAHDIVFTASATEAAALALKDRGFHAGDIEHDAIAAWVLIGTASWVEIKVPRSVPRSSRILTALQWRGLAATSPELLNSKPMAGASLGVS